eukprot:scaffold3420_cov115-Isochrysis_galbana.AAC.7
MAPPRAPPELPPSGQRRAEGEGGGGTPLDAPTAGRAEPHRAADGYTWRRTHARAPAVTQHSRPTHATPLSQRVPCHTRCRRISSARRKRPASPPAN